MNLVIFSDMKIDYFMDYSWYVTFEVTFQTDIYSEHAAPQDIKMMIQWNEDGDSCHGEGFQGFVTVPKLYRIIDGKRHNSDTILKCSTGFWSLE